MISDEDMGVEGEGRIGKVGGEIFEVDVGNRRKKLHGT